MNNGGQRRITEYKKRISRNEKLVSPSKENVKYGLELVAYQTTKMFLFLSVKKNSHMETNIIGTR